MFPFHPVVILPTYNNAGTLSGILQKVREQGLPVIVVNDGATDETADILAAWRAEAEIDEQPCRVIAHSFNLGKAEALSTGFKAADEMGFTHAVTLDTDGQLDPEQIPELLAVSRRTPEAFVLGVRDAQHPDYPGMSRLGRFVSNFLIRLESGDRVLDSQCGFRIYPLSMVRKLPSKAGRYGFETEIITRAVWAGYSIEEIPVSCRYFPKDMRITHFHPWADSLRSAWMHVRLLVLSLIHRRRNAA